MQTQETEKILKDAVLVYPIKDGQVTLPIKMKRLVQEDAMAMAVELKKVRRKDVQLYAKQMKNQKSVMHQVKF